MGSIGTSVATWFPVEDFPQDGTVTRPFLVAVPEDGRYRVARGGIRRTYLGVWEPYAVNHPHLQVIAWAFYPQPPKALRG